jgi:hypothetical protein
MSPKKGIHTKMDWTTDRRAQRDIDYILFGTKFNEKKSTVSRLL